MNEVVLQIPYPANSKAKTKWAREYSANKFYAGIHWAKRKQAADFWHMLTKAAITEAIGYSPQFFANPVEIFFYWNSGLDIDNNAVMGKMIVDGLKGRLIADDDRKHLIAVHHCFHEENYIKIVIKEA